MSRRRFTEVRRFDQLDSTNRYLKAEAAAGRPEGLVVVADHQTAGRGRLGRVWEAPPGTGLLASILLRPVLEPARLHLCALAVALAAADACASLAGVDARLKWPNDLVVAGRPEPAPDRKLAGVLAEVVPGAPGGPPGSAAVVVGIGLNVEWPGPPEAGGTSLRHECGRAVDHDELLERLLDGLEPRRHRLDDERGRHDLVAEARDRCATLGRRVRVETGAPSLRRSATSHERMVTGVAVDLTGEGHLVVETPSGTAVFAAGDVVHLRPEAPSRGAPIGPE